MTNDDDLRTLRERIRGGGGNGGGGRPSHGPDPFSANPSAMLVTVAEGDYPTDALAYYPVQFVGMSGTEAEGETPILSPFGGTFYAANVGSKVLPTGTYLVGDLVSGRWVVRFDG